MQTVFKKNTIPALLLFLVFGNILAAQSGDFVFDHISLEEGLSQSSVYSIIQDNQGFMWFTTEDGLNKYDGRSFTVYKNNSFNINSLSENSIYSIDEGAPGILWISTWSTGLNKYNVKTNRFTRLLHNPDDTTSLCSDLVYALVVDNKGYIWVGTDNGLDRLDTTSNIFKHYRYDPQKNSITGNFINKLAVDKNGNIWIGSLYNGLSMYNPDTDTFINYKNNPADAKTIISNEIQSLAADKIDPNIVWVGTAHGGVEKINSLTKQVSHFGFGYNKGLPDDVISAIDTDYEGNIWLGTYKNGLFLLNREGSLLQKFTNSSKKINTISQNSIYSIYVSKSGIIWVGTGTSGINIISPEIKKFKLYKQGENLGNTAGSDNISGLMEDQNKNLWICGWNSGITIINRLTGKSKIIKKEEREGLGLNSNSVLMTFKFKDGKIGIATTDGGLNIYNPATKRFKYIKHIPGKENSLAENYIMSGFEDKNGIVWIGLNSKGLDKWDRNGGTFTHFRYNAKDSSSIAGDQVYTMLEDNSNYLWVSSQRAGLSRLNKKTGKFVRYTHNENNPNSLSSNDVMVLYQSQNGTLWIGTYGGGLNKFNFTDNTFKSYKEEDGLPNNAVYGILEDENSNLWLSTNRGISKFNPQTEKFRNYDVNDGLQSNEFNSSYCKTSDGEIFFGGINGLNSFFPDEIKDNSFIPPVYITSLQILNKNIAVNEEFNGRKILTRNISYTDEIELTHSDYVISFEFTALNYINSNKNRYAYKLEGLDKDWNYSGNRHFATYSNLPPGKYTFRVKGSNNDNIWNEKGTMLNIIVIPVFWQTWWFRISVIVLLVLVFLYYYRWRTKSIKELNIKLEKAVKDKTNEMENLMDRVIRQEKLATIGKISGSIAHELRNPLGAVRQSVYFLKLKFSNISEKLNVHLNLIDNELSIADRVINDLLELTRLKKINKEYSDLKILIKQSVNRCNLKDTTKTIIDIKPENRFAWVDQLQMGQVFVNLIINAEQAMEGKGTIWFTSSRTSDDQYLKLDVTDSGCGIKSEDLKNIFEPLYTSKAKGTGLGLSICKQIIEKHNGRIDISSELSKGTKISIMLPLDDEQ